MILRTAVLILMTMGASVASHAALITNGGFENPIFPQDPFNGWTLTGNVDVGYLEGVCADGGTFSFTPCNSHSGTYTAALGPNGEGAMISQEVATTPGQAYTLTFFLKNDNGDPSQSVENWFGVTFDNQTVQAYSGLGNFDYQEYTFSNLVASSDVTEVGFGLENTPGGFFLDDVALNAVPEPASTSLVMLSLGLLGFGFRKYRGQKPTPHV
jgi:hypothetical protein